LRSTCGGGYKAGMGTLCGRLSAEGSGPVILRLADADDAALARAAMRREAPAAREIWCRFAPVVRRIVRRMLGPEHDVEDVVQDVFLRLFDRLPGLRDPAALRAFVVSISIRSARYELRRRRVRRLVGLSPTPDLPDLRVVSADHDSRQALLHLYRVLDRLSFRERTAFVLRFVEGMEIDDVASALEVSVPTTRRAVTRAWERIAVLAGNDGFLAHYIGTVRRKQP
jgi:RNA polymerase sigma-70 factor (ECF subfamily)